LPSLRGVKTKELMALRKSSQKKLVVLLAESDVLVRFALAEHLRSCDIIVVEAVNADDAKAILVAGPEIKILMSDAQLAGEASGFDLAQWVRRHRTGIEIVLTGSLASKVEAAVAIAARTPECVSGSDAATLTSKLNAMLAERKRRLRPQPKGAPTRRRRKRA
jgi:DNA-binding NtrC family response regulator